MPYRKPNTKEAQDIIKQGGKAADFIVDAETGDYIPATPLSSPKFYGRAVASNIIPALGGGLGILAGTAAMPAAATVVGPAAAATPILGAVGGGIGAAKLQDMALEEFAPDTRRQLEIDRASNPKMSTAIGTLTSLPFTGGSSLLGLPKSAIAMTKVPLKQLGNMGAIQGGLNVGQQMVANDSLDPRNVDWTDALISTGLGVAGSSPSVSLRALQNAAAKRVGFSPTTADVAFPRFTPTAPETSITSEQKVRAAEAKAKSDPMSNVTPEILDFYRTGAIEELAKSSDPLTKEITRVRKAAPNLDMTPEMVKILADRVGKTKEIDKTVVVPALAKENIAKTEAALQESLAAKDAAEHEAKVTEFERKRIEAETKAKEEAEKITEHAKTALAGGEAEAQRVAARAKIIEEATVEQKSIKAERKLLQDHLEELVDEEGNVRDPADRIVVDKLKRNIGGLSKKVAMNADRLNALYADEPISQAGPERLLGPAPTAPRGPTVIPPSGGMPPMPETQGSLAQLGAPSRQSLLEAKPSLQQGDQLVPIPTTPPLLPAPKISGVLENKPVLQMPAPAKGETLPGHTAEQQAWIESLKKLPSDAERISAIEARMAEHPEEFTAADRAKFEEKKQEHGVKKQPSEEVIREAKVPPLTGLQVQVAQQKGAKRRSESGAILPSGAEGRDRQSKVNDLATGLAANVKSWSGKLSPRQIIQPALERIYNASSAAGDALFKVIPDANAHANPMIDHVLQNIKGLTKADLEIIHEFRADKEDGLTPAPLPPHLVAAEKAIDDMVVLSAVLREGGPLVKAIGPNGETIYRPNEIKPNFNYHAIKSSIQKILRTTPTTEAAKAQKAVIRADFIEHEMNYSGASPEDAAAIVDRKYFGPPESGSSIPNLAYEALRYEQGAGIPRQYRDNVVAATIRGLHRQGLDMSIHANIESKPEIGRLFGYTEDGKGNKYPQVLDELGNEVLPLFGGHNEDAKAIFNSLVFNASPASRTFETLNRAASSGVTGTVTQVINLAQLPGTLAEYYSLQDLGRISLGISQMFSSAARARAIRAGAVNPGRNIGMNVEQSAHDVINRFVDVFNKGTGAEQLETAQRVGLHAIAEQVAWNRMTVGDEAFFDKFGPKDWRTLTPEEAVRYTSVSMARRQAGTYSFEGLPNSLLQGGDLGAIKATMSLSRWGIERSNHWLKNVWDPLKKGDVVPLIKSALGTAIGATMTQWIKEQLTSRKPKELTWEEWMNLGKENPSGDRDTANTIMAKIDAAGNLGIVGSLALAGIQLAHGNTMPRGYHNVTLSAAGNLAERAMQFFTALDKGLVTPRDLPMIAFETAKDNIQSLRVLDPYIDESGAREENLARRTGYLPAKPRLSYTLPNPFSEEAAYRENNLPRLEKIVANELRNGMRTGVKPAGPANEIRMTTGVNPQTLLPLAGQTSTGQGLPNYYNFIKNAQGEEAAQAALDRDADETIKRKTLYGRALVGAMDTIRGSVNP